VNTRTGNVPPLFVLALREAAAHGTDQSATVLESARASLSRPLGLRDVTVVAMTAEEETSAVALLATLMKGDHV
jgi:hypothetical protein